MSILRWSAVGLAGWAAAGAVWAASPADDPVRTAFAEYTSARARHDLTGAEAAATRALANSEARDGAGGSTAALALNLAMVRLELQRAKDALAPAQRAVELARGGAKGVDEVMARLVLGEAVLTANLHADEAPTVAALHDADNRRDLDNAAYPAALALARAAAAVPNRENIVVAWKAAALHAEGADGAVPVQRGRALTLEAAALAGLRRYKEAGEIVDGGLALLARQAPERADDGLTLAEVYFADAMALRKFLINIQAPPGRPTRPETDGLIISRAGLKALAPLCAGTMVPAPYPDYPNRPLRIGEIGAVVVRMSVDEGGKATSVKALSTLVDGDFREAVEAPNIKWTFKPDPDRVVPGCRLTTHDRLQTISFRIAP